MCVLYMSERVLSVAFVCVCNYFLREGGATKRSLRSVHVCIMRESMYIFLVSVTSMYACVYCEWE